jgi:hypothetical protein
MSRSKAEQDVWDQIFDDLILETEPPIRYIKDAVIITKNGTRFRVSPDDFAVIVARERTLDAEQSDIQSCSLSIDFVKIKRDVNRWTNKFIGTIESAVSAQISSTPPTVKKRRATRRKVD